MTRGFSLYLDALRFGAAFVVLVSHFAYPRFTEGRWLWIRDFNLGSDAVIVFFVLSGLVISYAVENKASGPGHYAFDRLTRLFSVAFPALLIGFFLDRVGSSIAPHVYDGWYYNPLPLWEQLWRGLTFSSEWTGLQTRLGTNGPYWSLSYEAAYYALFGVMVFTRGVRRMLLLGLGALVVGLNVLLLMPAWLIGVALQKRIAAGQLPEGKVALVLALAPVTLYALALAVDLPARLYPDYIAAIWPLRFSDEFVWNNLLAVLVAIHLAGMAGLLTQSRKVRFEGLVRALAAGSFSLYLVHYPLLQFLTALGFAGASFANDAVLLSATVLLCCVFASLFEKPLHVWRNALRPLFWPLGANERAARVS